MAFLFNSKILVDWFFFKKIYLSSFSKIFFLLGNMCAENWFFFRKSFFYFFYKLVFPTLNIYLNLGHVFKEFLFSQYLFIFYNTKFINSTFFLSSASGFNSSLFLSKKTPLLFYKNLDFLLLQCLFVWFLKIKDHLKSKIFFLSFSLGVRLLTYVQFRDLFLIFSKRFFYVKFFGNNFFFKLRFNTDISILLKLVYFLSVKFCKLIVTGK